MRLLSVSDAGAVEEIAALTSSTAVTVTVPVVAGPVPVASAVCNTVTLIAAFVSKSVPSKVSVTVAVLPLPLTPVIVVPVGAPLSVKSPVTKVPV